MAKMIVLHKNKYLDDGVTTTNEEISVNADNINVVENSTLVETNEKSIIKFNDGSHIYVIESKEEINSIINS